jgi:TolB-like protein
MNAHSDVQIRLKTALPKVQTGKSPMVAVVVFTGMTSEKTRQTYLLSGLTSDRMFV